SFFSVYSYRDHRDLHSFPTRRSQTFDADSFRLPARTVTSIITFGIEPNGTSVTCSPLGSENFSILGSLNGLGALPAGGVCFASWANDKAHTIVRKAMAIKVFIEFFIFVSSRSKLVT